VVGRYDGALKAEHASGRNMAPFVRREWGERAYSVMLRIKALLDPDRILNPGVVLNDDPEIHLKNLKPLPAISPLADKCIECGFCEPRCPSRFVTLSPRQRIVAVRELTRLGALPGPEARAARAALAEDFAYEGVATCVGDSMCQTSCPVKIDTGALVKELRATTQSRLSAAAARLAARNFAVTARLGRAGLRVASAAQRLAPALVRRVLSGVTLPAAAARLPLPAAPTNGVRRAVYFPSCLTRVLGRLPGESGSAPAEATLSVLQQAGFAVRYPAGLEGLCCGMPFASKGYKEAGRDATGRTLEALWQASDGGSHPVLTDASPCAGTLRDAIAAGRCRLRLLDFPAFWAQEVLPTQKPARKLAGTAVLHPTCTLVKGGGLPELMRVAQAYAERVVVPAGSECCGFAGDRGFLLPQVTASATRREAGEVAALGEDVLGWFSTCRTCEIGMSRATGRSYQSIAQLVLEAMRGA